MFIMQRSKSEELNNKGGIAGGFDNSKAAKPPCRQDERPIQAPIKTCQTISANSLNNSNQENTRQTISANALSNLNQENTHQTTSANALNSLNQENTHQTISADSLNNPNQENTHPTTSANALNNPNQENTCQTASAHSLNALNQENTHQTASANALSNPNQENTHQTTSADSLDAPNQKNTHQTTSADSLNALNQENTHPTTSANALNNLNQENTHSKASADSLSNPNQENIHPKASANSLNAPNQENTHQTASANSMNNSKLDMLLFWVLMPYYFYAWGRLGQKFALAALISLLTGFVFWLIKLAVHNPDSGIKAKEIQKLSGEKKPQISLKVNTPSSAEIEGLKCSLNKPLTGQQQTKMPFCRQLFLFFPLFYPLGLNLSLIPFLLIVVYLLAISSFGGYEKHFFNPTALLIVFMLAGYSYTASLSPSKPIASPQKAYKTYTSGVPGAIEPWRLASKLNTKDVIKASFTACLPGFAATACPGALLILAIFISVAFKRRPLWVACSCLSLCAFTAISQYFKLVSFSCLHILFLGMFPAMLLISASDYYSISGKANEQAVSGIIFGFFTLLFTAKAANPLAVAYAVLSAQILSPLISDVIFKEAKEP